MFGKKKESGKKSRKLLFFVMCLWGVICVSTIGIAVDSTVGSKTVLNWVGSILVPINYESVDDIVKAPSDLTQDELAKAPVVPKLKNKDNIINILLIGEESINMATGELDTSTRGRSDCNMVLTINRKKKTAKLISFLRDTYVQIPGYRATKLNAAYQYGGGPLLQETIQLNFGVITDGYVRVNFGNFQKIVDLLGGVDIELTKKEANYLNTTNYITKKKNRTVKEGMNHLNGNQAVGYARVRKQATNSDEHDDWGRTYRQRRVVMSIFEDYKKKSLTKLVSVAKELLPYATTNMKTDELLGILGVVMELKIDKLDTLSIPHPGGYSPNGLGDLVVNFSVVNKEISDFMEGINQATPAPSATPESTN